MAEETGRSEAEHYLRELAARADDIVGTHIRGITLGQDDLKKLSSAVRVVLGQPDQHGSSR